MTTPSLKIITLLGGRKKNLIFQKAKIQGDKKGSLFFPKPKNREPQGLPMYFTVFLCLSEENSLDEYLLCYRIAGVSLYY
jgi:hypothetical protein